MPEDAGKPRTSGRGAVTPLFYWRTRLWDLILLRECQLRQDAHEGYLHAMAAVASDHDWFDRNEPCPLCAYFGLKPNAETLAAMAAAERGEFEGAAKTVAELFAALHADA